jgi:hypothetical protein
MIRITFWTYSYINNNLEHAVVQLVEELRYKSEGSGFDSRWYHPSGRTMAVAFT